MLLTAIFMIGFVSYGYINRSKHRPLQDQLDSSATYGLIVGLVVPILIGLIVPTKIVNDEPGTLVPMQASASSGHTFILGTAGAGGPLTYHFLVRRPNGSLSPTEIKKDSTVEVVEDKSLDTEGRWIKSITMPTTPWMLCDLFAYCLGQGGVVHTEFRVPVGTFKQYLSTT